MAKKNLTVVSPAPAEDRKKAARMAAAAVQKRFGEGAIMRLGQKPSVHVDVIPTGSMGLDFALGAGGLPRGRIIEIYDPESSGKTTLTLRIVADGFPADRTGATGSFPFHRGWPRLLPLERETVKATDWEKLEAKNFSALL